MQEQLKSDEELIRAIIQRAGGSLIGRTRIQKLFYILSVSGMDIHFDFEYKHYGPFSKELAEAVDRAVLLQTLLEEERPSSWGGFYSIYRVSSIIEDSAIGLEFEKIIKLAAHANPIELELAATAEFLSREGFDDPWDETAKRKPTKINNGRLERSMKLLERFKELGAK